MEVSLSKVRWGRILLAAVVATVTYIVLVVLVSVVLPTVVAFSGVPDLVDVERVLESVRTWVMPVLYLLTLLPTVFAAAWAARGSEAGAAALHGSLIGLLVAIGPFFGLLGPPAPVLALLTVAAGLLGGLAGSSV